jgi:hypothetical protein
MTRKGIPLLIHGKSGLLWLSLLPFLLGLTWLLSSAAPPLSGQTDPLDVPFRQPLYVLHLSWTITAEYGKVKNDFYMLHASLPDQNGVILRGAEMGRYQSGAELFAGAFTTPRQVCESIKGLPPAKLSAIYNVIRCPQPPPAPKRAPAERAEHPASNRAPQVSIRLSEPDESLTIGLRITFIAEASDDKDTPQQLRYSWKVERLDTGKTAGGSTGSRNTLSWTPRLPGSARITVTVTDRDGAEGQDSIEVNIEKPKIEKIEFKGAERNKTSEYLAEGIYAARRGQYFGIDVTPSHFNSKIHNVRLFIDDERIEKGRPNPTQWVFLKAKLGKTKLGTTKIRYYVFTPSAIPIGYYKIEVALTQDETDEKMDRKALDPELAVLFNPFSNSVLDDVSVREGKPLADNEATIYTVGAKDRVFFPRGPSEFDVSPYAPETFELALTSLDDLSESQKTDAAEVAKHITYKIGDEILHGAWWDPYCLTGGSLENIIEEECKSRNGEWTGSRCYLGGTRTGVEGNNDQQRSQDCAKKHGTWIWNPYWPEKHPGSWKAVSEICKQFTDTGEIVKYGQCFTYGVVLTALLRSVGIPARTVTTWDSGHDKYVPWGIQSTFFDKNGRSLDFEVWNFHCWNEAWIPRVNSEGGWAILDATPQSRAADKKADSYVAVPGLDEITSVPRQPAGKQYPDGQDEVFVYTECNLPATNQIVIDCVKGIDCPDDDELNDLSKFTIKANIPPSSLHSATHIYFEADSGMEDRVGSYRPNASGSSPSYSAASLFPPALVSLFDHWRIGVGQNRPDKKKPLVRVTGPQEVILNTPFQGKVEVSNLPTDTPLNLALLVEYFPLDFNGGAAGPDASGPELRHLQEIRITPRNGTWTGRIDIPGSVFATSGQYRWKAAVGSASEGAGAEADIFVIGIPLSLTLPARLAEGEVISVKAVLSNTLDTMISHAELHLRIPTSWQTSDPVSVGPQELAPGAELILEARVKAGQAGKFLINAEARTATGPSFASVEVVVVGKPDLAIDALPIQGAPVGKVFDAPVEIINDGVEAAKDIEIRLIPVEGIKITGGPSRRVKVLEGKSQVKLVWKIRAENKGIFRLPMEARLPGGIKAEEILVIYAGSDDPEEMEAQEDAPEEGTSKEPGGAAGTESDITIDLDEGPEPGQKASQKRGQEAAAGRTEQAPGPAAGGGGGGGGPAVKRALSIPLPLLGLLALLLVNTGLVVALVMRRRRPAPGAQKVAASIEVIYRDGGRKTFVIQEARTTIGRADDNSLVLHDPDVSAYHAEIVISEGSFILRDLESANGTFLNGERIKEAPVFRGDEIVAGSTRLIINK